MCFKNKDSSSVINIGQDIPVTPDKYYLPVKYPQGSWRIFTFKTPFTKPMTLACGRCSVKSYTRVEDRIFKGCCCCWKCCLCRACCCTCCFDTADKVHLCGNCGEILAVVVPIPGVTIKEE